MPECSQATGLQPKSVCIEAQKLTIAAGPELLERFPARKHLQKRQVQKKPHRRWQHQEHSIAALATRLPEEVPHLVCQPKHLVVVDAIMDQGIRLHVGIIKGNDDGLICVVGTAIMSPLLKDGNQVPTE